jgi:restriction system protein
MQSESHLYRFGFPDGHPGGEPDWLPSPADVARARAQMAEQGVLPGLTEDAPVSPLERGEVPWLWWAGAALWVLIWPAALTLQIGGTKYGWLPWWAPLFLAMMHMAMLALPVLANERDARRSAVRRRFGRVHTLAQITALQPEEFENWCALLFQLMGYSVTLTRNTGDHGIDLELSNEHMRRGLVQCKRYRGTVGEPTVRDLYGTMTHANAERGWLLTTGAFSRQAREWCNGKPIELWDGPTLVALARKYR